MLVTNVRDEDIEDLLAAVRLLQRRHLVCVASLREEALDEAVLDSTCDDLPGAIARRRRWRATWTSAPPRTTRCAASACWCST